MNYNEQESSPEQDLARTVSLARSEDWDQVDELLADHANTEGFVKWARVNLDNPDASLRDLSASIFELAKIELSQPDFMSLLNMMQEQDENPYPSFRAACALASFARDTKVEGVIVRVKDKLKEFTNDDEVAEIAKDYLVKFEN